MKTIDPTLAKKTLHLVHLGSTLAKRALDERNVLNDDREKAASQAPAIVADMLGADVLQEDQTKQATDMLGTHAGTAQLLKSAVAKIAELSKKVGTKQAGDIGVGVDPSTMDESASPVNDNYVGQRSSEKKASDDAILAVLDAPGR